MHLMTFSKMNINIIFIITISILLLHQRFTYGDTIPLVNHYNANSNGASITETDLNNCEDQLAKYRRFLLQAVISFEDVCDAYEQSSAPLYSMADNLYHGQPLNEHDVGLAFLHNYQPVEPRSDIWSFFKILMAQFDDVEFTNIIRNAVIERCRIKSQQQRDEKRNSVVLGKKQRFHSWGGKRSQSQVNFLQRDLV